MLAEGVTVEAPVRSSWPMLLIRPRASHPCTPSADSNKEEGGRREGDTGQGEGEGERTTTHQSHLT